MTLSTGFLTPSFENKSMSFHFPEKNLSKQSEFFDSDATHSHKSSGLSIADSKSSLLGACGGSSTSSGIVRKSKPRNLSLPDENMVHNYHESLKQQAALASSFKDEEVDGNPLRLLRQNKTPGGVTNVLPLPPRDKNKPIGMNSFATSNARHQRKHPLLIPSKISIASSSSEMPPPPPPKPLRQQYVRVQEPTPANVAAYSKLPTEIKKRQSSPEKPVEVSLNDSQPQVPSTIIPQKTQPEPEQNETPSRKSSISTSSTVSAEGQTSDKSNQNNNGEKVPFYENYDNLESTVEELSSTKETLNSNSSSKFPSSSEDRISAERDNSVKAKIFGYDNSASTSSSSPITSITIHQRVKSLDLSTSSNGKSVSSSISEDSKSISSVGTNADETSTASYRPTPAPRTTIVKSNEVDPVKVRTVRRILGSSASQEESEWAVEVTQDSAHAVKLLRLKSLLPESLMMDDVQRVISVLEMSHWDVARAASFLLDNSISKNPSKGVVKVKCRSEITTTHSSRSDYSSTSVLNGSFTSSDSSNNNNTPESAGSNSSTFNNGNHEKNGKDFVRPTRV